MRAMLQNLFSLFFARCSCLFRRAPRLRRELPQVTAGPSRGPVHASGGGEVLHGSSNIAGAGNMLLRGPGIAWGSQ